MSGDFDPEIEVHVEFDFDAASGVIDYIDAKAWAFDRFGRGVRWRLIEREGRAVFSFARYPDALMFAMSIDGAVIREAGAT
jgi:hypothetical protein